MTAFPLMLALLVGVPFTGMPAPAGREPLPPSSAGPREVHADFDQDGRMDMAGLFRGGHRGTVELWVKMGSGHGLLLDAERATPESLGTVLGLRDRDTEGDPTCPRFTNARRTCGDQPPPTIHGMTLVVRRADGAEHIWEWNGLGFGRREVFE
jgi:hypothetical protein